MAPELLGESLGTGTSPRGAGYAKPPPPGIATRPRPSQTAHLGAPEGQRASSAISRSWGCLDRLGRSAWQHSKRLGAVAS
jgi:hypothetical protein